MKILLTSTSFYDTPGAHKELLYSKNFEIDYLPGPLRDKMLIPIIANYDGIICGDDEINEGVIETGRRGNLKVISKYGVGLDKIDLKAAKKYNIPVTNCIGVNQVSVAEHTFALILAFYKNICLENQLTKNGKWERLIGHDLNGKRMGIVGLGRIGKEIAFRAKSFGLILFAFDTVIDDDFVALNNIRICSSIDELIKSSDIISLNLPLTSETQNIISLDRIKKIFNTGSLLVNTARAGLVDLEAVLYGLDNKILAGYLTDVLEEEPMKRDHPFTKYENVIITPHIGSRTYENVERQGIMAVNNLVNYLKLSVR